VALALFSNADALTNSRKVGVQCSHIDTMTTQTPTFLELVRASALENKASATSDAWN
jgi:hypothetical protein